MTPLHAYMLTTAVLYLSFSQSLCAQDGKGLRGGYGGGGPGSILTVAMNDDVQQEIGFDPADRPKLEKIVTDFQTDWMQAGGGFRIRKKTSKGRGQVVRQEAVPIPSDRPAGITDEEWNAIRDKSFQLWRETENKTLPELKKILSTKQFKRLQEIHWQALGAAAYSEPQVIEALQISIDQQERIKLIGSEFIAKREKLLTSVSNGADPREIVDSVNALRLDQENMVRQTLTAEQLEHFKALRGAAFNIDILLDPLRFMNQ